MIILMVAAVASLGLGHYVDAGAIIGVVVIVALIGFIQEGKAEQALESIRNMLSPGPMWYATAHAAAFPRKSWYPATLSWWRVATGFPRICALSRPPVSAHRKRR